MRTISQEQRRSPFIQSAAFAFVAILATVSLAACGGEPSDQEDEIITESNQAALKAGACAAAIPTSNGTATVCHKNGSVYEAKKVNRRECCSHDSHQYDYIAPSGVTTCTMCMLPAFPCNTTNLKCCSNSKCVGGKCAACWPSGTPCTGPDAAKCCSGACNLVGTTRVCGA